MKCKYNPEIACNFGHKCYRECPFLPKGIGLDNFPMREKEEKEKCLITGNMEK